MDAELRRAWRFFFEHGSCRKDSHALDALHLAKAERMGKAAGMVARWAPDDDAELGDHEEWCSRARAERARRAGRPVNADAPRRCNGHEAELCVLLDRDGEVVESLGSILGATDTYRRVVEAELMAGALRQLEQHLLERRVARVTSTCTGVTFNVALVQKGERYGRNQSLRAKGAMVEFYDARGEPGGPWDRSRAGIFGPLGQFVTRYNLGTLVEALETHTGGLTLWDMPGCEGWRVDWESLRRAVHAAASRV